MQEKYRGKVTRVGRKYLTVVLFEKDEEIVGEISREIFPQRGAKIGQIFNYTFSITKDKTDISYELIRPVQPSSRQIAEMEREVRSQLKGIDLDKI